MEVASGAIGAVGLGIQLVGTVKKVMTFIQNIQDAPEDLASLGSSVKQLETILNQVTTLVESRSQDTDTSGSVDLLEQAVRNCEPNVTKLGKLVDKLQKKSDQSGKRRAAWKSLKLVVRKEDLDNYRSLIQGDLMALNTTMVLMTLQQVAVARAHRSLDRASAIEHSALAQGAQGSDPPLVHGEEKQVQDIHPASTWMVPGRKRGRRNVTCTVSRATTYQGFFGYIYVKKKMTHLSGDQEGTTPISEEVGYVFHPAFLRLAIEIHTGGKLSRSLRYYPILQNDLEIFKICCRGDLEGFRQALTRQEVPIHAQTSDGWTLLHLACEGGNLELCSHLIELGVDAGHEDIFGRKALDVFFHASILWHHSLEAMVRLMILGQEHVEEHDIIRSMDYYTGPAEGVECLLSPDVYPTELDWRRLPRTHVVSIVRQFAYDVPRWTNLVRRIVRQAEDLHCWHVDPEWASDQSLTLLDQLLGETWDPIKGAQVSKAWLEILAMEGLDVREYLEVEMKLREDNQTLPHPFWPTMKRFLIFNLEQKLTVEWDWWIDPDDPASLLCNEFRHMACRFKDIYHHREWVETWPFIISEWARNLGSESSDSATNRLWKHMIDLADSRATHRLAKREMKIARAKGTYSRKLMPGSWIA